MVLAPAACLLAAVGLSDVLDTYCGLVKTKTRVFDSKSSQKKASKKPLSYHKQFAAGMVVGLTMLMCGYVSHCTWVTSEAYSSPSIVLAAKGAGGNRITFDDFREAYFWLRQNTPEDAKVMAWWDYGYQITVTLLSLVYSLHLRATL